MIALHFTTCVSIYIFSIRLIGYSISSVWLTYLIFLVINFNWKFDSTVSHFVAFSKTLLMFDFNNVFTLKRFCYYWRSKWNSQNIDQFICYIIIQRLIRDTQKLALKCKQNLESLLKLNRHSSSFKIWHFASKNFLFFFSAFALSF